MPGRTYSSDAYRYGFNGKEKDDKGEWGQTHYDYGFRIYNPQIAKFLSVDPLTRSYPMLTPYQFASNTPIGSIDLDGLEHYEYWKAYDEQDQAYEKTHTAEEVATRTMIQTAILAAPFVAYAGIEAAAYVSSNWVYLLYNPVVHNEVAASIYGTVADDEWPIFAVGDNFTKTTRYGLGKLVPDLSQVGRLKYRWEKLFGSLPMNLELHHIIPEGLENHPIFVRSGLDINDIFNAIPLPKYSPKLDLDGIHAKHPAYTDFVREQLDEISQMGPLKVEVIKEEIGKLRNDLIQHIEKAGSEGTILNEYFKKLNETE